MAFILTHAFFRYFTANMGQIRAVNQQMSKVQTSSFTSRSSTQVLI